MERGKRKSAEKAPKQVEYIPSLFGESDILNPTIISFDGRRYRKYVAEPPSGRARNRRDPDTTTASGKIASSSQSYPGGEEPCVESDDEVSELGDVEELPSRDLQIKMNVPTVFFKYIIGKEGRTKQRIEQDTKCKIWLPRKGESGPVVFQAQTRRQLCQGKQRVEVITWANRSREQPTHFVGIPLNVPLVMRRFVQFKEEVLSRNKGAVDERLFKNPAKIHLTLGVLRLFGEEEEIAAAEAIEEVTHSIQQETLGTAPCQIQLVGLEIMNDDESAVDVLYVQVKLQDGSNRLQLFADEFMCELGRRIPDFVEQRQERQNVKLHATIMNSKFKEKALEAAHSGFNIETRDRAHWKRESFDARAILREHRDYDFGSTVFNNLHLSSRTEVGTDGYYRCVSKVLL